VALLRHRNAHEYQIISLAERYSCRRTRIRQDAFVTGAGPSGGCYP